MSRIDARLAELGFVLPGPLKLPPGANLPFPWISMRGNRVFISGHGPVDADGSLSEPRGKVGADVSVDEAKVQAGKIARAILSSLKSELGDLDRITV